jgi:mRNA interferase RelE/StbE
MNEMVTITREEYQKLRDAAEELSDLRSYDRARADLASGDDELVPAEYVNRVLAGESALRVFRDLRGLTQLRLAGASGVNRVQIADIEAGRKTGSVETLKKLAHALGIAIDDLV